MMNRGGVGVQTPNNQNGGSNNSIHKRPGTQGGGSGIKDSPPEQPLPTTPQQGGTTNHQTPNSPGVKERTMTRALPTPPVKKDASTEHPPVGSPPVKQAPPQGQPQQQGQQGGGQSIHQRPQSAMTAKPPPQSIHQRPHTTHQGGNPPQQQHNNNPHGSNVKPAPHNNSNNTNGSGDHPTTPTVTFSPPPVSAPPTRQAKVLKNFVPQGAGQLSLHVGDTVVVLSQNTNGMWAGSHAGKVGEFPADHVELLPLTAPGVESKPVQGGGNVITGVLPRTTTPRRPASEGPVDPGQRIIQEELLKSKEDLGPESEKEKMARMRQQVIIELINTEETYLKHLDLIITIFLFPLKTTAIVPETTIQTIFSNVEIIQNVNKEFFQNLENRMKRHSEISATIPVGDLFKKMGDYFKMYTTYCANHPLAVNTLVKLEETNPDVKNFLKICHTDKAVEGFRIYDYLIKPVQRICKYPLLIRELLKFTEEDHEDYPLLVDAQKKIDEVVDYINEAKRNAEGNQIVVDIQIQTEGSALVTPTRHLKKEGELMLHERNALTGNKPRKVIVFMFNDMLLVVRPKNKKYFEKDKRQKNCFTQKAHIHLGSARLIGISVEKESVENSFEIQYTVDEDGQGHGKTESVILSASSPEEERMWTKDIKAVIKEYQKKKYFELQKAKAEAMLLAEQQGQGGHNLPIQRSTSAVIDTTAISPRNSLKRMQSEPSMHQNINAGKSAGESAGNPGSPAPAAKPTTWSFSSSSTPTRVRRMDMGTQRSATAEILKNN